MSDTMSDSLPKRYEPSPVTSLGVAETWMIESKDGAYVLWSDYERMARKKAQEAVHLLNLHGDQHSELQALRDEVAVLNAKVSWLQRADRLVIWDGKEWKPRLVDPT